MALVTVLTFSAATLVPELGPWGPLGGTARAAEPGQRPAKRVAVFVEPRDRRLTVEAKALESLLRNELMNLEGIAVTGATGDPPTPAARAIGPIVDAGFRALNDRNGDEAEQQFRDALNKVTTHRGPFDARLMARILKGLGVANVLLGQSETAQDFMNASLNVWPDQLAAEYGWTLDAKNEFREVERRRGDATPGSLEISTDPEGAQIRVDGELKGFSPLQIDDLKPGKHWVEASLDGYHRNGALVEVAPGESSLHIVSMDELATRRTFEAAIANTRRLIRTRQVAAPMSNLQSITGADVVLVFDLDKDDTRYTFAGWMLDDGRPVEVSVTVDAAGDLVGELRGFLATTLGTRAGDEEIQLALDGPPQASVMGDDGDLFIDPNDPIFNTRKSSGGDEDSVTSEWWFWTIVGVAAAGLIVGGIVLLGGEDDGSGPSGDLILNLNRTP